jgi:hypothetical protein
VNTLRPMSIGEILDRMFQIYRSYFFAFVGLSVVPLTLQMVLFLFSAPVGAVVRQTTLPVPLQSQAIESFRWIATRFASSFTYFVMWPVFCAVAAQILFEQRCKIGDSIRELRTRWPGLLVISGAFWLLDNAVPRWLHGTRLLWHAWIAMPFWLSFIVSPVEAFALVAPLLLGLPIWTIERKSAGESFARSWTLSKGAYGRMFIACFLQSIASWSLILLVRVTLSAAFNLAALNQFSYFSRSTWIFLPSYIASIFTLPLLPVAITLIYYDQRVRLEGFDIEWMMDAAGMAAPIPVPALEAKAIASPTEELPG